jgi:hypothetical protein
MIYIILSINYIIMAFGAFFNNSEWWRLYGVAAVIFMGLACISKEISNLRKSIDNTKLQ